jgi:hypothetical protein
LHDLLFRGFLSGGMTKSALVPCHRRGIFSLGLLVQNDSNLVEQWGFDILIGLMNEDVITILIYTLGEWVKMLNLRSHAKQLIRKHVHSLLPGLPYLLL